MGQSGPNCGGDQDRLAATIAGWHERGTVAGAGRRRWGSGRAATTAGPAFADVGVTPSSEPAGGSGELTFRVTDDIPDAGTTSFELDLPADHPLLGVVPAAKFGWGLAIKRSPVPGPTAGRVTRIIWSAHSTTTAIQPGRYGTFSISVREFPIHVARVRVAALQTWSNGEVVQRDRPTGSRRAGAAAPGTGDHPDRRWVDQWPGDRVDRAD